MRATEVIMGMQVLVEIVDKDVDFENITFKVFSYLREIDEKFSTYKSTSEVSKINRGEISLLNFSPEMCEVLALCEKTKSETKNFFDVKKDDGKIDPSGLVKGWAIHGAANILRENCCKNFLIDIGSDIEVSGKNSDGENWRVGIKNPFQPEGEIIKVLNLCNVGVATSAKYARGEHIYNPNNYQDGLNEIVSVTIVAENILEADRFVTAIFAMGKAGAYFLEEKKKMGYDLEGYIIDKEGMATMTSGFQKYVK